MPARFVRWAAVLLAAALLVAVFSAAAPAGAQETAPAEALVARLSPHALQQVFPGADELEIVPGRPPAVAVMIGGEIAGYIYSTRDTVNATGFGGHPFDLVAGVALDGGVTGAILLEHYEAIIERGVPQALMDDYVAGFMQATLQDYRMIRPDIMRGATVSGRMLKRGLRLSTNLIFTTHVLGETEEPVTEPVLDREGFAPFTPVQLLESGALVNRTFSMAEIVALFESAGGRGAAPDPRIVAGVSAGEPFLEFQTALVTPASIGNNLFGNRRFTAAIRQKEPDGGLTVYTGARGPFALSSNSQFRAEDGYLFDRVKIVQGDLEIRLDRDMYHHVVANADYTPPGRGFQGITFALPADSGLDPLAAYDVVLMVPGFRSDGAPMTLEISVTYTLPVAHMRLPPPVPVPAWIEAWTAEQVDLSILGGLLLVVTLVFVFQDLLVRRRRVYTFVRVGVLAFTLGWVGYMAGNQLSIINLLSIIQAPFTNTGLQTFLLDPLMFVLTVYVGLTLFLLGRGVYCGWLCPFGALQELTNRLARLLRIPQVTVPPTLQERIWVVKYGFAAALIALVFVSAPLAEAVSEVEPFRTAVTVYFQREWPFVLYALLLVGAGLFVERFFCRVLCPLGGALAVLGRIHMFQWLRRKPQCGSQCRICEVDCPMGAIEPTGEINMSECLQCLDCQVDYYDDKRCPPLIERRKRRELRDAAKARAVAGAAAGPIPEPLPAE